VVRSGRRWKEGKWGREGRGGGTVGVEDGGLESHFRGEEGVFRWKGEVGAVESSCA